MGRRGIEVETEPIKLKTRRLTMRQIECARLVAEGLTSKEIARQLRLSPSTVDNHISAAMATLEIAKRSEIRNFFPRDISLKDRPDEDVLIKSDKNSDADYSKYFSESLKDPERGFFDRHLKEIYVYSFLFISALFFIFWLFVIVSVKLFQILTG